MSVIYLQVRNGRAQAWKTLNTIQYDIGDDDSLIEGIIYLKSRQVEWEFNYAEYAGYQFRIIRGDDLIREREMEGMKAEL